MIVVLAWSSCVWWECDDPSNIPKPPAAAIRLAQRDTVMLASDGLTDNLTVSEVVQRVRRGQLGPLLTQLAAECDSRMNSGTGLSKPDDLTVLLFRSR